MAPDSTDRLTFYIEKADIDRGADFLQRWLALQWGHTATEICAEITSELLAIVVPQLERTALRSFLQHDRSLYRAPEL